MPAGSRPDPVGRLDALPTWLLTQAQVRAHGLLSAALARSGTRGHHYRLLAALEDSGPASQADLGRATALDRSDVALGVDELERWGLAVRVPDPDDRRRKRVHLTPAGRRRLQDLDAVMQQVQEDFLAPLTPQERAVLSVLLRRLGRPEAF